MKRRRLWKYSVRYHNGGYAPPRVQTRRMYNTEWTLMQTRVRRLWFWWGMLIIGEGAHVWRQGIYGKSLYFSLNFSVNHKLFWKLVLEKSQLPVIYQSYTEMWLISCRPVSCAITKEIVFLWSSLEFYMQVTMSLENRPAWFFTSLNTHLFLFYLAHWLGFSA